MRTAYKANKRLVLQMRIRCGLLSITTVSLLVNKYDIQSILLGQVSLAAVNNICDFHEVMKDSNQIFIKDLL